jgi:hypothetical protein
MRSLKEVWVAVIVTGVGVVVEDVDALVEGVYGKYDENLLPLDGCEMIAEERNKVPEDGADS